MWHALLTNYEFCPLFWLPAFDEHHWNTKYSITNQKYFQVQMIAEMVINFGTVKDSFGFNYPDMNNLLDLYKILCPGVFLVCSSIK